MKLQIARVIGLGLVLGWVAHPAHGIEVMSSEELAEHCAYIDTAPKSEDAVFCVRYIQGFVDGAVATDERVTNNVADEFEKDETFSERAMRTRGVRTRISDRVSRHGPSVYAEFCLGEPIPLRSVVDGVVEKLGDRGSLERYPDARELVYATLRSNYPCRIDE